MAQNIKKKFYLKDTKQPSSNSSNSKPSTGLPTQSSSLKERILKLTPPLQQNFIKEQPGYALYYKDQNNGQIKYYQPNAPYVQGKQLSTKIEEEPTAQKPNNFIIKPTRIITHPPLNTGLGKKLTKEQIDNIKKANKELIENKNKAIKEQENKQNQNEIAEKQQILQNNIDKHRNNIDKNKVKHQQHNFRINKYSLQLKQQEAIKKFNEELLNLKNKVNSGELLKPYESELNKFIPTDKQNLNTGTFKFSCAPSLFINNSLSVVDSTANYRFLRIKNYQTTHTRAQNAIKAYTSLKSLFNIFTYKENSSENTVNNKYEITGIKPNIQKDNPAEAYIALLCIHNNIDAKGIINADKVIKDFYNIYTKLAQKANAEQ